MLLNCPAVVCDAGNEMLCKDLDNQLMCDLVLLLLLLLLLLLGMMACCGQLASNAGDSGDATFVAYDLASQRCKQKLLQAVAPLATFL